MICRVDDIVRDVRRAIDENSHGGSLLAEGDNETLDLDELIRSKVTEAVRRVHMAAPVHLLESGHNFGEEVYWEGDGSGFVLLPDDFMRLVTFSMSDWERPLHHALVPTDPEYALCRSRWKGLRGTPQTPRCVLTRKPEGLALEFYTCRSEDAYVSHGVYLPYPYINRNGGIDISERCRDAAIYMTASLTLTAYGRPETAEEMRKLSNELLE